MKGDSSSGSSARSPASSSLLFLIFFCFIWFDIYFSREKRSRLIYINCTCAIYVTGWSAARRRSRKRNQTHSTKKKNPTPCVFIKYKLVYTSFKRESRNSVGGKMREEWQKESPYNNLTEGKGGERKREGGNERSEQRETERERSAFSLPPPHFPVCVCVYMPACQLSWKRQKKIVYIIRCEEALPG